MKWAEGKHTVGLTEQMVQSDYLSAILKAHNSGYITRRTCFTAPPQTKGFRHETAYYEIHMWLYSQQQAAEVFCEPNINIVLKKSKISAVQFY